MLGTNVLERAREPDHAKPWHAYLRLLPVDLLPLGPLLLLLLLRRVREGIPDPARPLFRFALLWFVLFLGIFPSPILNLQSPALVKLNETVQAARRGVPASEQVAVQHGAK